MDATWCGAFITTIPPRLWYQLLNDTPGRVGPPIPKPDPDIRRYFLTWLAEDGHPFWSLWENAASWWAIRDLPNVHLMHFANLKTDLAGEMKSLAAFLGIDVAPEQWPVIIEHCSFDYMKANAANVAPLGGGIFEGGAGQFINKGVNGRWRDVLRAEDIAAYERTAEQKLGPACAKWLATGAR